MHQRFLEGTVPPALVSKTARQFLRPRGRVARRVGLDGGRNLDNLLGRLNQGEVVVAPPKTVPPSLPTGDKIAEDLRPRDLPPEIVDLIRRNPFLRWAPLIAALLLLILLLLLGFGSLALVIGLVLVAGAVWFARFAEGLLARHAAVDVLKPGGTTPQSVDALPTSPDFRIDTPGALPRQKMVEDFGEVMVYPEIDQVPVLMAVHAAEMLPKE